MKDNVFVDTNILIYAHDKDAGAKHERAALVVEELWNNGNGIISSQVIEEFYVNVTRKIPRPLSRVQARGLIGNYFAWHIQPINPDTILLASEIEERYMLSFWDALIISTASQANVDRLLTEDLSHGQVIEGILIQNPFLQSQA